MFCIVCCVCFISFTFVVLFNGVACFVLLCVFIFVSLLGFFCFCFDYMCLRVCLVCYYCCYCLLFVIILCCFVIYYWLVCLLQVWLLLGVFVCSTCRFACYIWGASFIFYWLLRWFVWMFTCFVLFGCCVLSFVVWLMVVFDEVCWLLLKYVYCFCLGLCLFYFVGWVYCIVIFVFAD